MGFNELDILLVKSAQHIIEQMPEKERKALFVKAIKEQLLDKLNHWEIKKLLENSVKKYAVKYMQDPEIQKLLEKQAKKIVEKLAIGTFDAVGKSIERTLRSDYTKVFGNDC